MVLLVWTTINSGRYILPDSVLSSATFHANMSKWVFRNAVPHCGTTIESASPAKLSLHVTETKSSQFNAPCVCSACLT